MRIIQISGTHVSHLGGVSNDNLDLAIDLINDLAPDFVVHTGDVTILDPDEDRDRVTAQQLLDRIEAPMRVLPGNHDVGEPGPQPFGGKSTTGERVAAPLTSARIASLSTSGTGASSAATASYSAPVYPRRRPSGPGSRNCRRRSRGVR